VRIRLLCVGKPREPLAVGLHDRYSRRLARLGLRYETESVAEVKAGGRYSDEHVIEREARALLERVEPGERIIALDERGELIDSRELAARIESWATPRATLIVGGPLGLHATVLERANQVWSLSPLTFPHELVRCLVVEQIYRALTIRRGVPYHK